MSLVGAVDVNDEASAFIIVRPMSGLFREIVGIHRRRTDQTVNSCKFRAQTEKTTRTSTLTCLIASGAGPPFSLGLGPSAALAPTSHLHDHPS